MASHLVGSFQLMKSLNRSLILNTIRSAGGISRAEIAKKTRLTPPTVTNIAGELLHEGLVVEGQHGPSSGGRKPILLKINSQGFFVAGIDVGVRKIRFALTNLDAKVMLQNTIPIHDSMTEDEFVNIMTREVQSLVKTAAVPKEKLIGIGIGMHGIVNSADGVALFAPNLNLKNIPLKQRLEEELQVPVRVENDARAMALGESWFGNGAGAGDLICINVGYGIGAGILMDHQLFRGRHGLAGEIGHTVADLNGSRCTCGNYGCLQTVAGHDGLKRAVMKEMSFGRKTLITEFTGGNENLITGKLIHKAALQGDELAIETFRNAGRYLGTAVTNLIHIVNPSKIIIGGGLSKAGSFLLDPLREVVKQRALDEEAKETKIVQSGLGDQAALIGAVTLVLAEMFSVQYDRREEVL
ncbi:ROK family transcriptional regulator [Bacillus sp. FJAT-42376]|uniref:ROK family transcriptional regulator n=1 Tax=Bacillus sp. FJAT-42376 TaxID=2014076 RepID=UPI000F516A2E|nr:ROK family transcriptional regulator [Bacillus sp. FJAT-42376]AZB42202.1 ROK family transcriptional regulator [Bacillus sp. FJAT-42376]